MSPPAFIESAAAQLLERHPPRRTLRLRLGGVAIEVRTNSGELAESLSAYLAAFLDERPQSAADLTVDALEAPPPDLGCDFTAKPPDPGKTRIKEEYADFADGRAVRKRLTGMQFLFGGGVNVAVGPCTANPNQVVNFVNNRFMQWSLNQGAILGHAAAVAAGGRGLALAGISGAGKSTLALHLLERGAAFVSNDRLLVRKSGSGLSMCGVAELPRVNPGTVLNNPRLAEMIAPAERERLARLPEDELWNLEQKYDVFLDDLFGPKTLRLEAPMSGLAVLTWTRGGGGAEVRSADIRGRPDLLAAFEKSPGLFYEPEGIDPAVTLSDAAYLEHLERCALFEIAGGVDFGAAADACMAFLESGRPLAGGRT